MALLCCCFHTPSPSGEQEQTVVEKVEMEVEMKVSDEKGNRERSLRDITKVQVICNMFQENS